MTTNTLKSHCHCGNLSVELYTEKTEEDFTPRTCQCDLCKQHGASWISDPEGEAKFIIKDRDLANFYRFGHSTSDFVICKTCGVLMIALCQFHLQNQPQ